MTPPDLKALDEALRDTRPLAPVCKCDDGTCQACTLFVAARHYRALMEVLPGVRDGLRKIHEFTGEGDTADQASQQLAALDKALGEGK